MKMKGTKLFFYEADLRTWKLKSVTQSSLLPGAEEICCVDKNCSLFLCPS
jgi:hypothetical protein